jgi:hypothetical protein
MHVCLKSSLGTLLLMYCLLFIGTLIYDECMSEVFAGDAALDVLPAVHWPEVVAGDMYCCSLVHSSKMHVCLKSSPGMLLLIMSEVFAGVAALDVLLFIGTLIYSCMDRQ